MSVRECQLIMVTENNNNKFYNMYDDGTTIKIEYGRVGAATRYASKPSHMWDKVYREKTGKGYKDITELKTKVEVKGYKDIEDPKIKDIVEFLISRSKQTIANNYKVSYTQVTQKQIDEAQLVIDELVNQNNREYYLDVDTFNKSLIRLYTVIPRKMAHVQDYLLDKRYANTKEKANQLIGHEQDLLDNMATAVNQNINLENNTGKDIDILEATGLRFVEVTDQKDFDLIRYKLGNNANQLIRAWAVENKSTQEIFDANRSKLIDPVIRTHLLWHGSRTENWWSIISTGLKIRPSNAVYTGSMFGDGLYFANKAQKSIGYTSLSNSYWSHGSDSKAYLALYDVQTGKQYDIYKHTSDCYKLNKAYLNTKGYDSTYAHAGSDLRNDEFIVYDSAQATIAYLVEIGK